MWQGNNYYVIFFPIEKKRSQKQDFGSPRKARDPRQVRGGPGTEFGPKDVFEMDSNNDVTFRNHKVLRDFKINFFFLENN